MTVATISVLFTIIFAGMACESGGGDGAGNDPCNAPKGDRPTWCDAKSDTNEPQEFCGDGDCTENCNTCPQDCGCPSGFFCNEANWCEAIETCGNGVCDKEENCLNCYDCGCVKGEMCNFDNVCVVDLSDPLLDYYWLEGSWDVESINDEPPNPDYPPVNVTVEAWDTELGAKVHGFSPLNTSYIKKNLETNEFILFVEYEDGDYAKGIANPNTLTVEFDSCNKDGTLCGHIVYVKI